MTDKTGLAADTRCQSHVPGRGHPESPARFHAAVAGARAATPPDRLLDLASRMATEDEIALCHTREYIGWVGEDVRDSVRCLRTGDTDVSEGTLDAALAAAGGVLAAADAVARGEARNAFCAVRPPGHHASADGGMGFCVFNNVAVAARWLQRTHGVGRVLIVDWDIHHGNGTQAIFEDDPSVFYFSTHRWPYYPGTGAAHERGRGPGAGYTLNCPLAVGAGAREVMGAFRERLAPAMRRFRPEFVLVSAGFDSGLGDPLGGFTLTAADFAGLTRLAMEIAAESAGGRLVSALEGGYATAGLETFVAAHVQALAGLA